MRLPASDPAAWTIEVDTLWRRLAAAATEAEEPVLWELGVKAGYFRRCSSCSFVSAADNDYCDGCGLHKP